MIFCPSWKMQIVVLPFQMILALFVTVLITSPNMALNKTFNISFSFISCSHPLASHAHNVPSALFALFIRLLPADKRAVPADFERLACWLVDYFVSDHCFCSFAGKQKSAENIA